MGHLIGVAELAASFAAKFGMADLARALGIAHDLAKADPRFQAYLVACDEGRSAPKCPHADPSAAAVLSALGPFSFAIVGHHTGLPDEVDWRARVKNADPASAAAASALLESLGPLPDIRAWTPAWLQDRVAAEMLIRMLFSCLVDADFLDTERHFMPDREERRGGYPALSVYLEKLNARLAEFSVATDSVGQVRAAVLASCRLTAMSKPGAFRLTVPTGGGKTLSGLAFALEHAARHQLDRVIIAIPYTSIIDQTARIYKEIFGEREVLEHHSAVDSSTPEDGQDYQELRRRLSSENWDCPLVVTTTVQLFESLLHNKTSRCRKLHNIAKSVIVLDEVQALPPDTLGPILDVLQELVTHYGCSVVFCTATQPDFGTVDPRLIGTAAEIVPNYPRHFESLRRVSFRVEPDRWTVDRVAQEMGTRNQILTVLNTRKDALAVAKTLGDDATVLHLSTLLCGHHRKQVIEEVRRRLKEAEPIRLVSTQVIEAGVDVDFPLVMRAMGPLDRIIQVAGRCNREGKMEGLGECVVFELEGGGQPRGAYRTSVEITRTLLAEFGDQLDAPESMRGFTRELFKAVETGSPYSPLDQAKVHKERCAFNYATVAQMFKLIREETEPLVIEQYPGADVSALIEGWKARPGGWFRRVSPYTVNIYDHERKRLLQGGYVRPHESGAWIYSGTYDRIFGISPDVSDPADLTI